MAIKVPRGKKDEIVEQIIDAMKSYQQAHAKAQIDVYRQNSVSVRIRIVDPDFRGVNRSDRHDLAWRFLEQLPDDVQSDISMLVLVAPEERKKSPANLEFD